MEEKEQNRIKRGNAMKKSLFLIAICIAITLVFSCSRLFLNKTVKKDSEILFQAFQATKNIQDPYNKASAIESIASVYSANGQYDKALKIIKSIEDVNIKAFALVRLGRQAWRGGQKDKALEILSHAYKVAKTIDDAHLKDYTFAMTADAYAEFEQKDRAVEVLSQAYEKQQAVQA